METTRGLLLAIAVAVAGSACASVRPWQKELLAHPCMQLAPRMGDPFLFHVQGVRENAVTPSGLGGGCGCG